MSVPTKFHIRQPFPALRLALAVFWSVRLGFGTFFLDLKPFLTSPLKRIGYGVLNTAFSLLPPVYLYTAITGGRA